MLTKSSEDYLETILIIENTGEKIKSVHIAQMLGVSRPAVNKAMNELKEKGFVEKTNYSDITLTESGREIACAVLSKHNSIKTFLMNLGVSEQIAEIDSCKIEHIISDETITCIRKFTRKM